MIAVGTNLLVHARRRSPPDHARWERPSTRPESFAQIEAWRRSTTLSFLAESAGYWEILSDLIERGDVSGPQVHDARVAALCLLHGVRELWTADRDFSRFPTLRLRNPLVR